MIAAAGVGAPLAALATNQAIGQKVLEEAIITLGSMAIVETGLAVKDRKKDNLSDRRLINHRSEQVDARNASKGARGRSKPQITRSGSWRMTPEQQVNASKRSAETKAAQEQAREQRQFKSQQQRPGRGGRSGSGGG